jgi:hypothetical protein
VGFTVHCISRFFARSLTQTENGAISFIQPILQILHPVHILNLKVLLVGLCNSFSSQAFDTFVNIHIEWQNTFRLYSVGILSPCLIWESLYLPLNFVAIWII